MKRKQQQKKSGWKKLNQNDDKKKNIGQNWCVCTIFIKKKNECFNIQWRDKQKYKMKWTNYMCWCAESVVHGTLASKTKTNTENNMPVKIAIHQCIYSGGMLRFCRWNLFKSIEKYLSMQRNV